jgi:hypothetical protein
MNNPADNFFFARPQFSVCRIKILDTIVAILGILVVVGLNGETIDSSAATVSYQPQGLVAHQS